MMRVGTESVDTNVSVSPTVRTKGGSFELTAFKDAVKFTCYGIVSNSLFTRSGVGLVVNGSLHAFCMLRISPVQPWLCGIADEQPLIC